MIHHVERIKKILKGCAGIEISVKSSSIIKELATTHIKIFHSKRGINSALYRRLKDGGYTGAIVCRLVIILDEYKGKPIQ